MSGHTSSRARIVWAAVAGAVIGFSALAAAVSASADPVPPPGDPAAPGQPLIEAPAADGLAAPAPPAPGPPPVPEIANPKYGSGHSDGPLGFLRDAWHQAQDPYNFAETPYGQMPGGAPPPPGAGPAPQLPPGFKSLNAPGSESPATGPVPDGGPAPAASYAGGPPLPPGYYPLNGPPPPPEYFNPPAAPPAAAAPGPIHATNLPPE